jgi:hypothetical protein
MADEITIGTKAIKEVQELRAELIKLSQDALNAGRTLSSISTPGALNKSGGDNAIASAQLSELKTKYISLNDAINKQSQYLKTLSQQQVSITKNTNNQTNATRQQAVSQQILRVETDRNIRATTNLGGAYAKASAQLLVLKKEAKDAAIAYGENSKKAQEATKAALDLDARIKSVDKSVGDSQRNVGNYSGVLTKAFSGLRLIANILPGIGIAGILSFAAEPIIEWVSNLIKGSKAINSIAESQRQLNQINVEGKKNAVEETLKVQALLDIAKDTTLTYKERMIAVKDLQNTYPAYFANLSKEQILAGNTAAAEKSLTEAILSRAKAQAATAKITENQSQVIDLEEEKLKISKQLTHAELELASAKKLTGQVSGGTVPGTYDPEFIAINKVASARRSLQSVQEKINALNEVNNRLSSYAIEKQKESILLDYKEEKTKKTKAEKKEDIEYFNSLIKARGTLNQEIDKEIDRLTTERIVGDKEALPAVNFQLEMLIKLRKQLNDLPETDVKIINNVKKSTEAIKELSEETKRYLKTFIDDFSSNAGLKNLIDSFDINDENSLFSKIKDGLAFTKENWQATTVDIVESAQEMYNFINNASQANFDAEKERLQAQYDVAVGFANGNKEAEEKLAKDLEAKKKDIANREAKAKKQQAIYNIAIDTAQAVVAALPNFVLAGIVAAFGLAQAVIVSSTKVPQYWMGGTHEGGLMMVNDGAGANFKETIVTPDGQIHKPQGKNVLMNAPAGTQIFTHDQWNDTLTDMLRGNGINRYNPTQAQGMTKEDFYDVMSETLGGQIIERYNLDANGFSKYTIKRNNITRRIHNRANGKR